MALRKAFDQANIGVVHADAYHVIGPVTINPPPSPSVEFYIRTYHDANAYAAGLDPVAIRYFIIQGADWDTLVAIKNGQISHMQGIRRALYAYAKQQLTFQGAEDIDNE